MMNSSFQKGIQAEQSAKFFLQKRGFLFLKSRYKTPYGEIDLLMVDKDYLVAIEVKFRQSLDEASWSITHKQKQRIANALLFFQLSEEGKIYKNSFLRFDVILICPKKNFVHIENAWMVDDENN